MGLYRYSEYFFLYLGHKNKMAIVYNKVIYGSYWIFRIFGSEVHVNNKIYLLYLYSKKCVLFSLEK
jgi:hypothetical protein